MKVPVKIGLLLLAITVYGALYMASSKPDSCEDDCPKYFQLNTLMTANRPYVRYAGDCSPTFICVSVNDSVQRNWALLADTACSYIRKVGLTGKSVAVISASNQDTLAQQTCP